MSDWVYAVDIQDVPVGRVVPVRIGERTYAVCNHEGSFVVVDHQCPHAGGPLGQGEIVNGCLVCPVHQWPWDLKTGLTDPTFPHLRWRFVRHEIRNGRLFIDVSAPVAPDIIMPR